MTKVLIIGYVWPEPNSSAAGARMLQLIQLFLRQGWSVIFASPAADSEHSVDLAAMGIVKVNIQLNDSSFDKFVADTQPDIVLFDRFMMEEQFSWRVEKQCPQALRILDTEDLHSLRSARHQALKQQRALTDEDYCSELALREVASILRSDLTLMISDVELQLLVNRYQVPPHILQLCRFMLPPLDESVISAWPAYEQRQHFVTIGNFRHEPNWDAVRYLKEQIWPLIRKQLPEAELHIYGSYPPPKATQLHNPRQGFYVEGWAENAAQVMSAARVCLAPLRFGAGIKGKLVEAMQCGTPSVTTQVGAEAMHEDLPWNGAIVDDPQALANEAVRLYQDQAHWQRQQHHGIAIINHCYNGEQIGRDLLQRIETMCANLHSHRLQNFTGCMLRHHSMKSSQYMSQWIEAKNRLL